jgi:hypothetical protein
MNSRQRLESERSHHAILTSSDVGDDALGLGIELALAAARKRKYVLDLDLLRPRPPEAVTMPSTMIARMPVTVRIGPSGRV